jgi:hypothetical protein
MTIPVFVNDRAVWVEPGTSISAAVTASDPELGRVLLDGRAKLTDGRGIALDPAATVYSGAILRVVVSARKQAAEADADA